MHLARAIYITLIIGVISLVFSTFLGLHIAEHKGRSLSCPAGTKMGVVYLVGPACVILPTPKE